VTEEHIWLVVDAAEELVNLPESTDPNERADCCLADVNKPEYCRAQDSFPGFVDEDDNPTGENIAEGDEYYA